MLATELVCYLRYKRHYFTATGLNATAAAAEFLEHATQEQQHADMAANRITQLRGEPDFNPDILSKRSHAEYVEGSSLLDMVKEDLVAERIAIASYSEIVRWLGDKDPTTRRMIEQILEVEEEHADDLITLLAGAQVADRVGVLGGTFDPVHVAHIAAAAEARHQPSISIASCSSSPTCRGRSAIGRSRPPRTASRW